MPLSQTAYPTNPALPHSHRYGPQLQTAPHHESVRTAILPRPRYPARNSTGCGYNLVVTWAGRSSNHTGSRGSESSPSFSCQWSNSIDGSPTIAVSSLVTPANSLASFRCSVLDLGFDGTYRVASVMEDISTVIQFALRMHTSASLHTTHSVSGESPQQKGGRIPRNFSLYSQAALPPM